MGNDSTFIHLPVFAPRTGTSLAPARTALSKSLASLQRVTTPLACTNSFPRSGSRPPFDIIYPNANNFWYANTAATAKILAPPGIRELSVCPSNRALGASNIFLTVLGRILGSSETTHLNLLMTAYRF